MSTFTFPTFSATDAARYGAEHADTLRPILGEFFRARYGYREGADMSGNVSQFLADPFEYAGRPDIAPGFWADLQAALNAAAIPTVTDATIGAKTRAEQGDALAIMRRREAMALADRAAAEARAADAEREMQDLRAQLASGGTSAVTPWGPDHPDWDRFWVQAARDAERAGNCGEYDRHATEMGAPTRYDLRQAGVDLEPPVRQYRHCVSVTVPVTLHVDVTSSSEDTVDSSDVRYALLNYDGDVAEALSSAVHGIPSYRLDYSIDETEDETDEGDYADGWTNPGRA